MATATQEFKLKGLSASDLQSWREGHAQEAEVEGVEEGKVLLLHNGGRVHAMSARCTHYGAPLKNGVASVDGRLMCPWHGGEFAGGFVWEGGVGISHEC